MWKNLYQKTMYEAYKTKEHLGYKIVEFENMFAVLWNNQNVPYYNIIHCDKFGQKELDNFRNVQFIDEMGKGKIIPIKREFDGAVYDVIVPIELIEEQNENSQD